MTAVEETATAGRTPEGIRLARTLISPALRRWVARLGEELGGICRHQLGFEPDPQSPGASGGKLLRPAIALLCTASAGGDVADTVPACVAMELIHNGTLIHDDIMDGDETRRHRRTAWARYGVPSAMLAGDALLGLAFEVLADDPHPASTAASGDLGRTLRLLAMGQERDLAYERIERITLDECLAMLEGKTGVLLGYACSTGVRYGGAPDGWAARFERFGSELGVAFQLVDDLLGIWGDPSTTGKAVGADLQARKKSAPVVAALGAGSADSGELARLYAVPRPLVADEIELASVLVERAGGREWTVREVQRRVDSAWGYIDGLDLDPRARRDLADLASALVDRAA